MGEYRLLAFLAIYHKFFENFLENFLNTAPCEAENFKCYSRYSFHLISAKPYEGQNMRTLATMGEYRLLLFFTNFVAL